MIRTPTTKIRMKKTRTAITMMTIPPMRIYPMWIRTSLHLPRISRMLAKPISKMTKAAGALRIISNPLKIYLGTIPFSVTR